MSLYAELALPATAIVPGALLRDHPTVNAELGRVVPMGSVTQYLWLAGTEAAAVVEHLRTEPEVKAVSVLDEVGDRVLLRASLSSASVPFFRVVEESGAQLVQATGRSDGWTVELRFPDQDAFDAFHAGSRATGLEWSLRGLNTFGVGRTGGAAGLTPKQYETIAAALEAGYFDVPRGTTIAELAESLGRSSQAVSERLRRGLARVVAASLDEPDD